MRQMKPTRGNITGSALTVPAPTSWCSRPRSAMCSPCTTAKTPKAPVKPFIISTWPAARNRSAKLMTGYLYLFMAQLMKEAREAMPNTPSSSSQYVLAAIKYIQFNYSHDISVDDIAKAVGVSRSHLYRVFMSNVGQSPIDYLTGYRISEACSLLKNTGLSIAEIAVSAAFLTSSIFPACSKRSRACRRASTWPRWRRRVLPHRRPSTRNISRTNYKEQTCLLQKIRSLLWRSKRSPMTETAWPQGRSGRFCAADRPRRCGRGAHCQADETYAFGVWRSC